MQKYRFIHHYKLLKQPFVLLDSVRHRWILIIFSVVFGILFINIFVPFNINRWNKDSGVEQFIRLSGFGIITGLVLFISQFGVRKIAGVKHFCVGTFLLWFIGELFFMAVFFIFYQSSWDISIKQFLKDIPDSFKYTLLGVLIPYSLALLFISQIIQKTKLNQLQEKTEKPGFKAGLLDFPDEKGIVRFSISGKHILYLESADNYVIIHYISNDKLAKQILRNSMKNIESLFGDTALKRCHRSFMVNLQKIEFADYGRSKCQVKLFGIEKFIPVSRKFYPEFKPFVKS
jgi:hypothetical protein